ncbi:MAG: redoxin domain-containing protein, partial [Dehalococcoidia bacterium]
ASGSISVAAEAIPSPTPTEPPLVNTPVPVANTAPDFTLPSIEGAEYTLSQFRGTQPVAVVFYRAYW